jgi:hypothetical protein
VSIAAAAPAAAYVARAVATAYNGHQMNEHVWHLSSAALLAGHLAAMGLAAVGPVVAAALGVKAQDDAGWLLDSARRMARWSLGALIAGALLGGALLLPNDAGLRAALGRFPTSAYAFGGAELVFSALCIGLQLAALRRPRRGLAWLLAIVTSTNLLYHFPPLMAVLGKLVVDPSWAAEEVLERRDLLRLWIRPEILARWVHFTLASIAVATIAGLVVAGRHVDDATSAAAVRPWRRLAGAALAASVLQLPTGLWLLVVGDGRSQAAMMGEDLVATASFGGAVIAALALLHTLAAVALGETSRTVRRRAAWLLAAVVLLMSVTLRYSRGEARLEPRRPHVVAAAVR